jgi:competence protein ComGC
VDPKLKNQEGNTLVELVMVMMLLVLFGVTIGAIVVTGSQAQSRIQARKNAQIDARIALSYITVRLRQSDKHGAVFFQTAKDSENDALVIRNEEFAYDQWIYFSDGHIYEFIGDIGEQPDDERAFPIVDVEGLNLDFDASQGVVRNSIAYHYGEETYTLTNTVRLKAAATY